MRQPCCKLKPWQPQTSPDQMAAVAVIFRVCAYYLRRPFGPGDRCAGFLTCRGCSSSWQVVETCVPPYRGPVALMPTELEVFDYNLDIHDSELENQEDTMRLKVGAVPPLTCSKLQLGCGTT